MIEHRNIAAQSFGPKILEAYFIVLLDQINHLRENQGMPPLEPDEILASVLMTLAQLEPYNWENDLLKPT